MISQVVNAFKAGQLSVSQLRHTPPNVIENLLAQSKQYEEINEMYNENTDNDYDMDQKTTEKQTTKLGNNHDYDMDEKTTESHKLVDNDDDDPMDGTCEFIESIPTDLQPYNPQYYHFTKEESKKKIADSLLELLKVTSNLKKQILQHQSKNSS